MTLLPRSRVKGSSVQVRPLRLVDGQLCTAQARVRAKEEPSYYDPVMATTAQRRNRGDDSIYFDAANNCWTGAISLGFAPDGKRAGALFDA